MGTREKYSVSDVLDSFGINKFTWFMLFMLILAMIFDGYSFMIVNTTNIAVARTFWPDVTAPGALMGSLSTFGLLGMIFGGAFGGIIGDKIGRKKTLVLSVVFYSVFTLPQAFANNLEVFAIFRMLAGLGIGACIPIVNTIMAESVPAKRRGVFITVGVAGMIAGWALAGFVGNPIMNATAPLLPGFTEQVTYAVQDASGATTTATMYANWRLCYLIGGAPIILAVILGFVIKETPHWYVSAGKLDMAVQRLSQIEKMVYGKSTDRDSSLLMVPPKPSKTSPPVLFSKKYIVASCAIWSTAFIAQFCVFGMNSWLPTWFVSVGYSATDAVTLQTWNNVAAIVANASVGYISDVIGRKRNLILAWILAIIAIVLCSVFVAGNSFGLCLALMLLFGFALNYTITAIEPIMPESYPTQFRSMGVAWAKAFARFGGAASSIILGYLATSALFMSGNVTNWSSLVLVLMIPLGIGLICTLVFVQRETKGKSMDDIQTEIETN